MPTATVRAPCTPTPRLHPHLCGCADTVEPPVMSTRAGTISREEMLSTIESFCRALPEAEGCDVDPRAVLPLAFDAFANDDQLLDYERFVELVSSSLQPLECVIEDEKPDYSSVLGIY